jgi:predicted nucleic acid-binding protein
VIVVLDTNVLSGLMQKTPDPAVIAWLNGQAADSVWTTSVTVFEVRFGLDLLAKGRRRTMLDAAFLRVLEDDLENRVLDFDDAAARAAAALAATRQRRGRTVDLRDTMIAGITLARRATLATRNIRHFTDLDVPVVDPWA